MYYPKSQIKANLYTNGGELKLDSTNQPYIGDYYTTSDGKSFAGSSPNSLPNNILLVPISTASTPSLSSPSVLPPKIITVSKKVNSQNFNYDSPVKERYIPTPTSISPSRQDYIKGSIFRYFCKKTTQNLYFEIDNKTYTDLKNQSPLIAYELYIPILINWILIGNKDQVFFNNKALVSSTETTQNLPGFFSYFKNNFTEFYLEINLNTTSSFVENTTPISPSTSQDVKESGY